MKKGIALVLITTLLLGMLTLQAAALPSDIRVQAENYVSMGEPSAAFANWGSQIRVYIGDWTAYKVNFAEAGTYSIRLQLGAFTDNALPTHTITPYLDGVSLGAATYTPATTHPQGQNWEWHSVGLVEIKEAGEHEIKLVFNAVNIRFNYFDLVALAEFGTETSYAGATPFIDGDTVPRGTDTFTMDFNADIAHDSLEEAEINVSSALGNVAFERQLDADKLILKLKDTMDYETRYTISIVGLKNQLGQSYTGEISFETGTESNDSGSGVTMIDKDNTSLVYEALTLKGHVESSTNIPISGRKVSFEIEDKDGTKTTVIDAAVTGEGGLFSITYQLPPNTPCGKIILTVYDEYTQSPGVLECIYVSEVLEEQILSNFKDSTQISDVTTVFGLLKEQAGFDISADIEHLGDKDAFYDHFIGAELSDMESFLLYRTKYIIMETLLQTTVPSDVETILDSAEDCELVGIDKIKTDCIINNRSDFVDAIISFDELAIEDLTSFLTEFGKLADKYYLKESGIMDSVSSLGDMSGYLGQGITLDLGFTEEQTSVSKVTYRLNCADKDIFEIYEFNDGNSSLTYANGELTVERTYTEAGNVTSIGKLTLTLPEKVTTYTLSVSGEVEYIINGPYPVTTNITPKNIGITAMKNLVGNYGGSVSSSPVNSMPAITINKNEEVQQPEEITQNEAYSFTDMDSASWAKESVEALVQSGIISKSDDRLYRPNDNVTREEFVKLLVCVFGAHTESDATDFVDVEEASWYAPYIASAVEHGFVNGKEDGRFGVGEHITRQDMAVMVYRALMKMGYPMSDAAKIDYSDTTEILDYAYEAVSEISKRGIMNGTGNNLFSPKGSVTRAMSAKVIYEISKVVGI